MTLNRRSTILGMASSGLMIMVPKQVLANEPFAIPKNEAAQIPYRYRRREVDFKTDEPAGTIVVDSQLFYLYYILGNGRAIRYGIGVGRYGARWTGEAKIARKAKWPKWTPTPDMLAKHELYKRWVDGMPGGLDNPLGARALYLMNGSVDNQFRIHGTPAPESIGKASTSGCFRMLNADVIELYDKVDVGTRVVVLPRVASKKTSLFGPVE